MRRPARSSGPRWGAWCWLLGRDVTGMLVLVHLEPQMIPFARDFFAAVTYGAPATGAVLALVNHRQALGDARSPMIVGIGGNVVNAFFAYGLIYGHWGLPRLGVAGSGFATAASQCLELAAMITLVAKTERRPSTLPYRQAARELIGIGVPGGLQMAGELIAFNAFTAILGSIGAAEMAAHQIALVTIQTSFLPGDRDRRGFVHPRRAGARAQAPRGGGSRGNRAALILAAGFMAACGVVFGLFGHGIAQAFTKATRR